MAHQTITIISELDNDIQAWTFQIEEADLIKLMEKYDGKGTSVVGDALDIAVEIDYFYK